MPKKWLYRLIMSYIPIFFAVIFCLMLLFFMTLSDLIRNQTIKANEVFAGQVMQIVDSTLKNIDTVASKNLLLNNKVTAYFDAPGDQPVYSYYELTEELQDFLATVPMVESVYLYRESDAKIVMQHFSSDLATFGDKAFIAEAMQARTPFMWSDLRIFSLFSDDDQSKRVISLVKKVPYYSGEQGLIVLNVRADSLYDLLRDMKIEGVSSLCMADGSGNSFEGLGRQCGQADKAADDDTQLKSAYTNWTLHIGMNQMGLFAYVSKFSYLWVILGFVTIVGGMVAMTYISHWHYRPLDQVLNRISSFSEHRNSLAKRDAGEDEFAFIDKSLENLIEHTNHYDKLHAEGILHRRIQLFKELQEGTVVLAMPALRNELEKIGMPEAFDRLGVVIIEIDYYAAFAAAYSTRDQSLFKFTLRSAIQEIADAEGERLWTEWVAPHRLGLMYRQEGGAREKQLQLKIKMMADRAKGWVDEYLKFTVTIGIAEIVQDAEALPNAFKQAVTALERKVSLGPDLVYIYDAQWDTVAAGAGMPALLKSMSEAAQLFRIGNPEWEGLLLQAFSTMSSGIYAQRDLAALMERLKADIEQEIAELPLEFQEHWRSAGATHVQAIPDDFEWVGDAQAKAIPLLHEAQGELQGLRMNREQYTLASSVKAYVAEHYANPDISLAQVSDEFAVNVKTLSRIFKEEIGEKFVDYLARIRMDHAKQLLEETAEPVQEIAEKVGYLYPMSFIRVFKKIVGTTPGDYRKAMDVRK
ncbi:AraC family transcriptional regulator [Paenibacillus oryzisoli]|uniref:AraC family transcriptional regulator n=1 Tax=Paenibacillus oryzisoli TaxID=1850517 RepID=UPI003D2CC4BC